MSLFSSLFSTFALPSLKRFHGETGEYFRVGSDKAIDPSPTVIVSGQSTIEREKQGEDDKEQIWLMIETPSFDIQRGDRYMPPEAIDPDRRPFVCTGRSRYRSASHTVWEFVRISRVVQGSRKG